nr:hypothetical protein K70PH128C1_LOCUS54 [Klebsiella phage vB_Ko_K70PH128C1]
MTYRTAIIIALTAILGCSYVGASEASYSTPAPHYNDKGE